MSTNNGKEYERIVQNFYQAFVDNDTSKLGLNTISVQHNVELKGKSGNIHQIDVFWSFELAGTTYTTIVEAKDWAKRIPKEKLHSFKALLDDIPGSPKGIFVSKVGFQEGAVAYAQMHGIELMTLDKEHSNVYNIHICSFVTYYENVMLFIDDEQLNESKANQKVLKEYCADLNYEDTTLFNPDNDIVYLRNLMYKLAKPHYYKKENQTFHIDEKLVGNWLFATSMKEIPLVKINGFSFDCYNRWRESIVSVSITDVANYVVNDILIGKWYTFNSTQNRVSVICN